MSSYSESRHEQVELALHSDGSDSSQDQRTSSQRRPDTCHDDIEMKSNGSSGHDSNGHDSLGSSRGSLSGNGKDSAVLLESSECHKSPSPPSSSNAFSLISASSEQDNPSTSGCSSEQSAKAKTQKELMKTLKELKTHLPPEKRSKGKSNTLATLKYALRCVKQVRANEEYYQLLMINDSHSTSLDISSYTIEEIENITCEFTLKSTDIFAVAVSLNTGKIVYISDQAASTLNCKRDVFKNSKFVEFLAPQDVSVFYSFTTPYRLPSWSMCTSADSSQDCMQEKSFFCRIRHHFHSKDRERDCDIHYHPFRMMPYLMKVQDAETSEDQLCCLLLAERVHSGYEAPRIPLDKRIFTTTHSPNCVFQDVDERAVPLLGFLPQDLIGTPVLMYLHPSDRAKMLVIHKKILQFAGQPFDYSPVRFCTHNGEYITIDTSWSSFVNPWSRKVSFIIGRHKIRTGPVNEDVFAAPSFTETKTIAPDIQEITEQIHRVLLQPVHNSGSSGYGSLGSNGSHEQVMSAASSSDSNGNNQGDKPRTFQEICKGVHNLKNKGQQVSIECITKTDPKINSTLGRNAVVGMAEKNITSDEMVCKEQPRYSYQQINCLDSVIRYLESCNIPSTMKRKCESSSNTTSSTSDDDKQRADDDVDMSKESVLLEPRTTVGLKSSNNTAAAAVIGTQLKPLALPSKAASVVSITSQCSYSSTIVHVGDKKLQPELEIIEDGLCGTDPAENQPLPLSSATTSSVNQEKEYWKLGLTKEVLAAHTQKEEQTFLSKFKELRQLKMFESPSNLYRHERPKGRTGEGTRGTRAGIHLVESTIKKVGKNRKSKSKRIKQQESSDSTASHANQRHKPPLVGLNNTSWSPSETSQASYPAMPFPAMTPAYTLPVFTPPGPVPQVPTDPSLPSFNENFNPQDIHCHLQPPQYSAPLVTSMVALVLPNYMFPQMNSSVAQPFYPSQPPFTTQPSFPTPSAFTGQPAFPAQPHFSAQASFCAQPPYSTQSFHYNPPTEREKAPVSDLHDGPSRASTPQFTKPQNQALPPLFQSRCSSPLQLNLLQLEEMPKERLERGILAGSIALPGTSGDGGGTNHTAETEASKTEQELVESAGEAQNSDTHSTSSDLLDLLLQEDSQSGTGSALSGSGGSLVSGSMGSGSNGCDMSGSGTGSSQTSNTSKYFESIDSSEVDHKSLLKKGMEESEHFIKYVLQDPIWLLMANTDDSVMMTYQIPSRDLETVLKEDREKLKRMQKLQPKFTEEQKKELVEAHPWIKKGGLPKAIDITECSCCEDSTQGGLSTPYDVEIHDLELSEVIGPSEEESMCI
ncbi:period circadian protein homolog 2 isoform X2 [Latimeria chalumnae]|uniref:period circadian protein homolog 2 isoform X2 n=1 Tax=Latimeria chalumnae TaxID=7897 RepID=UPI0003C14557|nr:PREDICTED: period circadian protein homolog 2 isoform X2 [Latimeria chalumnae]|eukprot:XP_006012249.1 PREDICTED: period circadian protein homolog 2 isoform X2 [Latimeria chalumnae]